jgi:hypothetical protein
VGGFEGTGGAAVVMRKFFEIVVQPWEAERLKVLIGRSRAKGVELGSVTRQLDEVIREHRDEVAAMFTKQHGTASSSSEEAAEWWDGTRMAEALWGPQGPRKRRRFRTIDGGKKEEDHRASTEVRGEGSLDGPLRVAPLVLRHRVGLSRRLGASWRRLSLADGAQP